MPNETTAGEYPASGHAYISDEGALCVHWPDQKVVIIITTNGMATVAGGGLHYTGFCREMRLDGGEWPHELRSVMCADYVATLKEAPMASETTAGQQVDAGFFRAAYPHKVAPECSCEVGETCQHPPCCYYRGRYYGGKVPENVRSILGAATDVD